jgi:hypothetical protein
MPNTKAVGVAYADPSFESVTVSGAIVAKRWRYRFYHPDYWRYCRCQP